MVKEKRKASVQCQQWFAGDGTLNPALICLNMLTQFYWTFPFIHSIVALLLYDRTGEIAERWGTTNRRDLSSCVQTHAFIEKTLGSDCCVGQVYEWFHITKLKFIQIDIKSFIVSFDVIKSAKHTNATLTFSWRPSRRSFRYAFADVEHLSRVCTKPSL